jgi:hypothetical protein
MPKYVARMKDGSEVFFFAKSFALRPDGAHFWDDNDRQVACVPAAQLVWVGEEGTVKPVDKVGTQAPLVIGPQPSVIAGSGGAEPQ